MAFIAPLALGTAATAATGTAAATAATAGLFGTAGTFSLATTLGTLGSLMGGLGAMQSNSAQTSAAEYNAQLSRQNAALSRQKTQEELEIQDRERRLRLGSNIARAGANNTGFGGSTGDILQSNAMQEELELMSIKSDGALRAAGFENTATLDSMQAESSKTAGMIGAGANLLSGTSKLIRV
jgi:hypothetical protein